MDFPKLFLAPLAGISNPVFRKINRAFGAQFVFSEMVSADGIVRHSGKTEQFLSFSPEERPFGIQLFGAEPGIMAEAAQRVYEIAKPETIDLNFGCPVHKVVRRNGGSALLRDPDRIGEIIRAVCQKVSVPVTAKIRAGWRRNDRNALEVGKLAQESGAAAITLHARTQEEGFSGQADWTLIQRLKESLTIPVIGNGDVISGEHAMAMFRETGCDGVMIARGSFGNPWIFSHARALLEGKSWTPPDFQEKKAVCLDHLSKMIELYGLPKGLRDMRKHFGWYIKGMPNVAAVRRELMTEENPERVKGLIVNLFEGAKSLDPVRK